MIGQIFSGAIQLMGLLMLAPHLNETNAEALLTEARGKKRRQLERLIAQWFPRPDVPPSIQLLGVDAAPAMTVPSGPTASTIRPERPTLRRGRSSNRYRPSAIWSSSRRPQQEGGESLSHREVMRWLEPNRGYASMADEPNAFGLTNSLVFVTLEPSSYGTALTLSQYYDSQDLAMHEAVFDEAFADIAQRLIARFGGCVIE
jgi:hypothetical protein